VVGAEGNAQAPERHEHAGLIVDARNGEPIDRALATAYASAITPARGACPEHREQINQSLSERGNFDFQIDTKYSSYFAVYCSNGFQVLEISANSNRISGTPVSPNPIMLFPNGQRLQASGVSQTTAARQAITRVLDIVADKLRRLASLDAAAFSSALGRLTTGDQQTVKELTPRTASVTPLQDTLPAVTQDAPLRVLDDATIHLRYFARVAGDGFYAAIKLFSPTDQATVNRLQDRPFALQTR